MKRNVLIIKEDYNSFEQYYTTELKKYANVCAPYKKTGKIGHLIRALCKRSGLHFLVKAWLGSWKRCLKEYDTVIVFDNCATDLLLKSIKRMHPESDLKVWLWNIPAADCSHFAKYAEIVCFDEEYAKRYSYRYVHQFVCINRLDRFLDKQIKWDAIFIGADKGRYAELKRLAEELERQGKTFYFYVLKNEVKDTFIDDMGITVSNKMIPYAQVLEISSEACAIVELCREGQQGLTLRSLEAMYLGKKLITNNHSITAKEFYTPSNIYLLGDEKEQNLQDFLSTEVTPIGFDVIDHYSGENWLQQVIEGKKAKGSFYGDFE